MRERLGNVVLGDEGIGRDAASLHTACYSRHAIEALREDANCSAQAALTRRACGWRRPFPWGRWWSPAEGARSTAMLGKRTVQSKEWGGGECRLFQRRAESSALMCASHAVAAHLGVQTPVVDGTPHMAWMPFKMPLSTLSAPVAPE